MLDFQRGLITSDDGGDLIGQLADEVADLLETRPPSDADAYQIDLVPDERAERLGILVGLS